jgi:phosphatidylinositol alpha-1,6-mannosyltransferase
MPTTLIVTNDFPPRIGGIEAFVATVCEFLDQEVVVLTSGTPGAEAYDARLPFPVVRRGRILLPTPATARTAVRLLRESGSDRVVFGAAAPLGLLGGRLRAAGGTRMVALSHGHETWWARVSPARVLLRRIGNQVDAVTVISDYTAARIATALTPAAAARLVRLAPPIDVDTFQPAPTPPARPRAIGVGRFVRRKGFDTLLVAWRQVLDRWRGTEAPDLVLIGAGRDRRRLAGLVRGLGLGESVSMPGPMDRGGVAEQLRQASVFALPMRTMLRGLDAEGLGLAALEAAACGLPVIVGNSGGAPETVRHGETGYVVDPRDPGQVAGRLLELLADPAHARAMGMAGRCYVDERFGARRARLTLRRALDLPD